MKHIYETIRENRRIHIVEKIQPSSSSSEEEAHASHFILFVHGLGGRIQQFEEQINYFTSKYTNYLCVSFDWMGHGESDKPLDASAWDTYAWKELCADVRAIYDKYSLSNGKNIVVGHSMGSGLSMFLAMDQSELNNKISNLILIGSSDNVPPVANSWVMYLPSTLLEWTRGLAQTSFRNACYHSNTSEELIQRELKAGAKNAMHVLKCILRQAKWPTREELQGNNNKNLISVPTLILSGESDRVMLVKNARNLSTWIPGSKFVEIPNSAHVPMFETPDITNKLIDDFIHDVVIQ